jgi:predicted SAM-dependent methyltransferase
MTPFTPDMKVLEVGGGDKPLYRPNLDVRKLPTVDLVCDLAQAWPVKDGEYDGVFSKFAMEHVSWRKVRHFAAELCRVLKPAGTAFVIIPNTEAQILWAQSQGDDWEKISQCLFGDQDYGENAHAAGFSPAFAIRIFREAGFESVAVLPFGELATDMIVEARKGVPVQTDTHDHGAALWTPEQRKEAYNRHYFDGGRGKVGGYSREGYWDYPVHWTTFAKIMEQKPESVLELGCARGYVLKRLQDAGVRAQGLEVSDHCYQTRVCDGIKTWDLTRTPWPFRDQEFDLSVSVAVLEHIPESAIEAVASEIRRVSRRGLHGVDFGEHDDGFDKTHCLFRDQAWWDRLLNPVHSGQQKAVEKDELEKGPIPLPEADGKIKINCGSYRTMFHHGWINLDVHDLEGFAKQFGYTYRRMDLTRGINANNGSVDMIFAAHFLEHLTYEQGAAFLAECRRVLKPGGLVRLSVPDARELAEAYLAGELWMHDEISSDECAKTTYGARKFWQLLVPGHQAAYDWKTLSGMLREAGFQKVEKSAFRKSLSPQMVRETTDMFPEISLFVEAVKE